MISIPAAMRLIGGLVYNFLELLSILGNMFGHFWIVFDILDSGILICISGRSILVQEELQEARFWTANGNFHFPRILKFQTIQKIRKVGWRKNSTQEYSPYFERFVSKNHCRRSYREHQECKKSCIRVDMQCFFIRIRANSFFVTQI